MNDNVVAEFIVPGPAASVNWKFKGPRQRKNYTKYKSMVADIAKLAISSIENFQLVTDELQATIYYFHITDERRDIDNILKPIFDGLGGEEDAPVIWNDDYIVARIIAERFERSGIRSIQEPTPIVADAIGNHDNFVYVKLERMP